MNPKQNPVNLNFTQNLYQKLIKFTKYRQNIQLIEVDFQKSWWVILWQSKYVLLRVMITIATLSVIRSITPFMLGYIVDQRSVELFYWLVVLILLTRVIALINNYYTPHLNYRIGLSISNSANYFFLTTDPKFHTTKSSGQIISKINRGETSMNTFMSILVWDILPLLVRVISIIATLFFFDFWYGLVFGLGILLLSLLNIVLYTLRARWLNPIYYQIQDLKQQKMVESLQQALYIRSIFATEFQVRDIQEAQQEKLVSDAVFYRLSTHFVFLTDVLFNILVLWFGVNLLQNSSLGVGLIASLLFSVIGLSGQVKSIGRTVNKLVNSFNGIQDLFEFIRNFGQPSYPVMSKKK